MLVSNSYLFVKQIFVWNQTEKKKLKGITFTLFFPFQSVRFSLFRQKYMFNTYNYTFCFLKETIYTFNLSQLFCNRSQILCVVRPTIQKLVFKRRGTGTTQPFICLPRRRICMRCCMKPDFVLNQSKTKLSHTGGGSINNKFFLGGGKWSKNIYYLGFKNPNAAGRH